MGVLARLEHGGVSGYQYSYYAWPGLSASDVDGDGLLEAVASVYQGVVVVGQG